MTHRPDVHDPLAEEIRTALADNPHLTTNLLASQLNAKVQDIVYALDSYEVVDDQLQHNGPGQGGGWIPEEIRATLTSEFVPEPEFIGYRWPDGTLHDQIFDAVNPAHREEVGLPPLEGVG